MLHLTIFRIIQAIISGLEIMAQMASAVGMLPPPSRDGLVLKAYTIASLFRPVAWAVMSSPIGFISLQEQQAYSLNQPY